MSQLQGESDAGLFRNIKSFTGGQCYQEGDAYNAGRRVQRRENWGVYFHLRVFPFPPARSAGRE